MVLLQKLKERAKALQVEVYTLFLAYRDPRTPWYARVCAAIVVAYALSPLDLIPDFIPVLGYLDDLILVPAGIALALRLIPKEVVADCRERARGQVRLRSRAGRVAAIFIGLLWILVVLLVVRAVTGW